MVRLATVVALSALLTPAAYAQQPGGVGAVQGEEGRYVVFFGLDSATLDAEARQVVQAAADEYRRTGAARVEVRGYADTLGSADYNEALSERRAAAVAEELIGLGVPPAAITRAGLGEAEPLVPTGDGVREPRNRRVEIELERPPAPTVATPPPPPPAPAAAGAAAPGAPTTALEVALTEETLQGTYFTDADWIGLGGNNLALSLLFSDDRDIVGSAAVMAPGLLGNVLPDALSVSFGGKAYAALLDEPDDDVFALAPGVEGRYALPAVLGTPGFVVGNIFYAPDIVTFGEADDVVDFNVRYELQFTQRLVGLVGYRLLAFDRDEGEDDVVENLQAGVRFAF